MPDNEMIIHLTLDDKASKQMVDALNKIKNGSDEAGKKTSGVFVDLASKVYLAKQAIDIIVGAFKPLIDAAIESEDSINRLNYALKSQGTYTEELSNKFQKMATSLQSSTRYSDEAVMDIQKTLVQIGDVAPAALERVTQAALDLSTVMGRDTQGAALLLSKAAQGNTTALKRLGITIDENIPKGEKLSAVLKAIEEKMGGSAQNDVKNFGGQIAVLNNTWSDLLETLGKMITKNQDVLDTITGLIEVIKGLEEILTKVSESGLGKFWHALNQIDPTLFGFIRRYGELKRLEKESADLSGGTEKQIEFIKEQAAATKDLVLQKQMLAAAQNLEKIVVRGEAGGSSTNTPLDDRTTDAQGKAIQDLDNMWEDMDSRRFMETVKQDSARADSIRQLSQLASDASNNSFMEEQRVTQERIGLLNYYKENYNLAHQGMMAATVMLGKSIQTNLSSALTGIITGTMKAKDAFKAFGDAMLRAIVDFMVQKTVAWVLEKTLLAGTVTANVAAAGILAEAWYPAAVLASLATAGGNAVGASAGIAATFGVAKLLSFGQAGIAGTSGNAASGAEAANSLEGLDTLQGIGMAEGGSGVVSRPTLFLAGEAGPERFNFTPVGKDGGGNRIANYYIDINVDQPVVSKESDIDYLTEQISRKLSREVERIR